MFRSRKYAKVNDGKEYPHKIPQGSNCPANYMQPRFVLDI